MSVSHGGANGFYFQDTMLLQSFWCRPREERLRASKGEQHMISTWECRNSEFISGTHWRNQTAEREWRRERNSPKGKAESEKWRKRNRGRERESGEEEREVLKKEGVSRVRELRLHVVVEGMVWIWRGTSSQVRLSCQPRWVARFTLLCSSFSLWSGVCSARAGLCFPPLWYFPLSHAASLLTACFRWVLDLELGALQGLCSSLAAVWLICLYRLRRLFCLLFVSPHPTVVSHIAFLF